MALTQIKPALQYSDGRSKPWSGAKTVNCFSEKADGDKAQDFALMLIPGLDRFLELSASDATRSLHAMGDTLYAAVGTALYAVSQAGTYTNVGTIPGASRVRMADNGTQLAICAGWGRLRPELPAFSPHRSICRPSRCRLYRQLFRLDDREYRSGDLFRANDGTSYDLLDIFSAEGSPDGLFGLLNDHRELLMMGTDTIEIFYNSAAG
jgi:hypothetical protein